MIIEGLRTTLSPAFPQRAQFFHFLYLNATFTATQQNASLIALSHVDITVLSYMKISYAALEMEYYFKVTNQP